jgi:hypothetical protein
MTQQNKYSSHITEPKSQGASQAMLYATGLLPEDMTKPQIGIASVWFEGNPCNMHLLRLAEKVKEGVTAAGLVGMRFNTIGVSNEATIRGRRPPFRHCAAAFFAEDSVHGLYESFQAGGPTGEKHQQRSAETRKGSDATYRRIDRYDRAPNRNRPGKPTTILPARF